MAAFQQPWIQLVFIPLLYSLLIPSIIFCVTPSALRPKRLSIKHVLFCLLLPSVFFILSISLLFAPLLLFCFLLGVVTTSPHPFQSTVIDSLNSNILVKDIVGLYNHVFPALSSPLQLSTGQSMKDYLSNVFPSFTHRAVSQAFSNGLNSIKVFMPLIKQSRDLSIDSYGIIAHLEQPDKPEDIFFKAFNETLSAQNPNWAKQILKSTSNVLQEVNITSLLRMPHLSSGVVDMHERITSLINGLANEIDWYMQNGILHEKFDSRLTTLQQAILNYAESFSNSSMVQDLTAYLDRAADKPEVQEKLFLLKDYLFKAQQALNHLGDKGIWESVQDYFFVPPNIHDVVMKSMLRSLNIYSLLQIICSGVVVLTVSLLSNRGKPATCVARVHQAAWTGALTALAIVVPNVFTIAVTSQYKDVNLNLNGYMMRVLFLPVVTRATGQAFISLTFTLKKHQFIAWAFAFAVEELTIWRAPLVFRGLNDFLLWYPHAILPEGIITWLCVILVIWITWKAQHVDEQVHRRDNGNPVASGIQVDYEDP